jgi:hypothetical protein
MTTVDEFAEHARHRLPQPLADRWISLCRRPAVAFPDDGDFGEGEEWVVSDSPGLRHGGLPLLPDGLEWPTFEDDRGIALRFVAELDCAVVAEVGGLDQLPKSGHLLFFCVEDRYQQGDEDSEPLSQWTTPWTAGKVLYLPESAARHERPGPERPAALELRLCPAHAAGSPPSPLPGWMERYLGPGAPAQIEKHVDARYAEVGRQRTGPLDHARWAATFVQDIDEMRRTSQSGGHPYALERLPELEAARCALRRDGVIDPDEQAVLDEAAHWVLLLQDDIDEARSGIGYWLLRDDDLAAGRYDRVYFEVQY